MFASLIPTWEPSGVWGTNYINSVGINYVKRGKVKLNPLKFRLLLKIEGDLLKAIFPLRWRYFIFREVSNNLVFRQVQLEKRSVEQEQMNGRRKRIEWRKWRELCEWWSGIGKGVRKREYMGKWGRENIWGSEKERVMRKGGRKKRKDKKAEITKNTDQVAILVFLSHFFGNFLLRKYYFLSFASFLSPSFLPFVNLTSIHNISNSNNNNNHHQILSS